MFYIKHLFVFYLLLQGVSFAQDIGLSSGTTQSGSSQVVAAPAQDESDPDPDLRGLSWNRYAKGDYVILSIDEAQGRWLLNNIENASSSCLTRWGLKPTGPSQECRIFCVPNRSLLKKLFNLDAPKAEVRKNEDGTVEINVIWICIDSLEIDLLTPYITHILLSNESCPFWFSRGAEVLNRRSPDAARAVAGASPNFPASKVLATTQSDYFSMSVENRLSFDTQSALLCMMLRKELGQTKLLSFLGSLDSSSDIFSCLETVYGYRDIEEFNSKYASYCSDLLKELSLGNVPDQYFVIKGAQ